MPPSPDTGTIAASWLLAALSVNGALVFGFIAALALLRLAQLCAASWRIPIPPGPILPPATAFRLLDGRADVGSSAEAAVPAPTHQPFHLLDGQADVGSSVATTIPAPAHQPPGLRPV